MADREQASINEEELDTSEVFTEEPDTVEMEETEAAEDIQEDGEVIEENSEDSTDEGKKSLFGKKKEKKDKKDIQIDELTDRLKRTMAEFDNFRKRTEKEKSQMYEIGAKDMVSKILPVLDNFERGLATVPESEKESAFVDGIDKIYKQFVKALEDAGVKAIEAVGTEFDPNFHNAVMHGDDDTLGENIVAEEFQKGYLYRDSVIRHSMVRVVN